MSKVFWFVLIVIILWMFLGASCKVSFGMSDFKNESDKRWETAKSYR